MDSRPDQHRRHGSRQPLCIWDLLFGLLRAREIQGDEVSVTALDARTDGWTRVQRAG